MPGLGENERRVVICLGAWRIGCIGRTNPDLFITLQLAGDDGVLRENMGSGGKAISPAALHLEVFVVGLLPYKLQTFSDKRVFQA